MLTETCKYAYFKRYVYLPIAIIVSVCYYRVKKAIQHIYNLATHYPPDDCIGGTSTNY